MARQTLVVLGDAFRCWRCKAVATLMLVKELEDGFSSVAYCDECWIAETQAYQPLVAADRRRAVQEAVRVIGGDDERQAGVKG